MNKSTISIITVVYNAVTTIEETILSVINQTYNNIEYIIIDGGSQDGTIDIIKKYANRITYWISEPDKGIYNAMNKGIEIANGEWIIFMNSGDTFYSSTVIADIIKSINNDVDVIYGNTNLIYKDEAIIDKPQAFVSENDYMPFCHQSSIIKAELIKKYKFDEKYKICADRNLFYNVFKLGGKFQYVEVTIANYETENGISATSYLDLLKEKGMIEGKSSDIKWKFNYGVFVIIHYLKTIIKMILPESFIDKIHRINRKRFYKE